MDPNWSPRWGQMADRVRLTLGRHGDAPETIETVLKGLQEAGVHRSPHFTDEEDPAWLHPGRVLLLLRVDAGVSDPEVLRWAAGVDQAFAPWTAPGTRAVLDAVGFPTLERGLFQAEVQEWDDWLTAAVLLDSPWDLVLLADALDHLRHLHVNPDPGLRARGARVAEALIAPVADRAGGTLQRRIRWWVRRVAPGLAAH